ncbi:MAG: peptidoglycan DD-metalloendopeptidase family protein [Actinobacteria bacterium]|nr:peptidoglycan DD-metalloendopeptidase family protein [Actinomycetota bacterium]
MQKKLLYRMAAGITAFLLLSMPATAVLADRGGELQSQLDEARRRLDQNKAELGENADQQSGVAAEIRSLDQQIINLSGQINALTAELNRAKSEHDATAAQLEALKAQLAQTVKQLEEAKQRLAYQKSLLNHRIKGLYKNGRTSYVAVLFGSSNFKDFVNRLSFLGSIASQDARLVSKVKLAKAVVEAKQAEEEHQKRSIEAKKVALATEVGRIGGLKSQQEAQAASLQEQRNKQQALIDQLKKDEKKFEEAEEFYELNTDELVAQINQWNAQVREAARARAEAEARARAAAAAKAAASAPAPSTSGGQYEVSTGSSAPESGPAPAPAPALASAPAPASASEWVWPSGTRADLTSTFGYRIHPITGVPRLHAGIDIGLGEGTPIYAAHSGIVSFAGWAGGYGNYTIIENGDGISTTYAHQSAIVVSPGDYVQAGQLIGYIGTTGLSTGPHLHFEIRVDGEPQDPLNWL